jgi:septal ring factor EnvC (AmiA/AmiB activator)
MHWIFTGNPQVLQTKIKALQAQLDVWEAYVPQTARHIARLETQIEELRSEISDHKAALHKLRGQVHGPRAQIERLPARQVQFATKDDLRRRAGIIAGQPAPHNSPQDVSYDTGDP